MRTLLLFGWLVAFYTIPEGIAAPYAAKLGGGSIATGLVLASTVFSTAIVMPLFTRLVRPRRRLAWMGPLAVLTCATLVLTALRPGLLVSLAVFSLSAAFGVYQLAANTAFVVRVPKERRAQAFGIADMGVIVGPGVAFVTAGAAAEVFTPAAVIAVGGGIGALVAMILACRWRQISPPGGAGMRRDDARVAPRPRVRRRCAGPRPSGSGGGFSGSGFSGSGGFPVAAQVQVSRIGLSFLSRFVHSRST